MVRQTTEKFHPGRQATRRVTVRTGNSSDCRPPQRAPLPPQRRKDTGGGTGARVQQCDSSNQLSMLIAARCNKKAHRSPPAATGAPRSPCPMALRTAQHTPIPITTRQTFTRWHCATPVRPQPATSSARTRPRPAGHTSLENRKRTAAPLYSPPKQPAGLSKYASRALKACYASCANSLRGNKRVYKRTHPSFIF